MIVMVMQRRKTRKRYLPSTRGLYLADFSGFAFDIAKVQDVAILTDLKRKGPIREQCKGLSLNPRPGTVTGALAGRAVHGTGTSVVGLLQATSPSSCTATV